MSITVEAFGEYKIKVEEGKDFENSLFKEIYENASRNINEIISQSNQKRKAKALLQKSDFLKSDDYNNIIAFTGDRGTGKSSSMVSFAEALVNKDEEKVNGYFNKYLYINQTNFHSIEIVDPSLFNSEDTLFEIIISKMFSKFQKRLSKDDVIEGNYDAKRELIKSFQKVYENLKTIHDDKNNLYDQEVIEALSRMAKGTNLRDSFKELVDQFLSFFGKNNGFLVIAIDDFDLNVGGTYAMLENIRQFLIQDNVIILIACKYEQLHDSLNQAIIKHYEDIIRVLGKDSLNDSPKKITEKYLNKLFPYDHRHYTPDLIQDNSKTSLIIRNNNIEIINELTIQEGILNCIYTYTGLFISKPNFGISQICPNTLREIINFTSSFDLSNINNEVKARNIERFRHFYIKEIASKIDRNNTQIFDELEAIQDYYINQYIISWLIENKKIDTDYFNENLSHRRRQVVNVVPSNSIYSKNPENSSFADVLNALKIAYNSLSPSNEKDRRLIYFIKVYYSLRVYNIQKGELNSLEKTIAGELINDHTKLFPKVQNINAPRDRFYFNGFKNLRSEFDNIHFDDLVCLCFFISYQGFPIEKSKEEYEIYYKKSGFHSHAVFNSLSFISNAIFYKNVFGRFFNTRDIESSNLYKSLKEWQNKSEEDNRKYNLLFNPEFFEEFVDLVNYYTRVLNRKPVDDFETSLYTFIFDGSLFAFRTLSNKYPYLKLSSDLKFDLDTEKIEFSEFDFFFSNPILVYWKESRENTRQKSKKLNFSKVLNEVFSLSLESSSAIPQGLKDLATRAYNDYIRYLDPNERNVVSSQGAKQAINNLIKQFSNYPVAQRQISASRRRMDINLVDGLNEINNYLLSLING